MQYWWKNGVDQGINTNIRIPPSNNPVTLMWHQHQRAGPEDPISCGHKGPVQVCLAKTPGSAAVFDGSGTVWTKATDFVNANSGKHTFVIPKSIPSGDYLIRGEITALHATSSCPGAQFYIGCVQVTVQNGDNANPPTIALPGAYKAIDPGITINIYNIQSYTAPGGPVWSG
ncbi:lytic polysaccharide monooxygenase [Sphaerobolus stellatus SS14]|nr:lytic polysaccharide monooxygenase [Sphaerobolus stellatus SS14]